MEAVTKFYLPFPLAPSDKLGHPNGPKDPVQNHRNFPSPPSPSNKIRSCGTRDPAAAAMSRCISFTAARDWCYRRAFAGAGLRPSFTDLGDGTTVHCWVPRSPDPARPALVLIHGFGANATWQWGGYIRPLLLAGFDVYVPDLLFFGESRTARTDRTESFQARSVMAALESLGVRRFGLVGVSYGGFVGYRIAAMFPAAVERVALCCAGVCIEEADLADGLFVVSDITEAAGILLPQTPDKLRRLMRLSFCNRPPAVPSCFLSDYIDVMCTDYLEEKTELLNALIKDRKISDLPKISQPTLIVWGEQDQIFPLELGHRLKRYLEENSELVVIENAGHAVNLEKSKEFCMHLKAFFTDSSTRDSNRNKVARWPFTSKVLGRGLRRVASKLPLLPREKA